MLNSPDALVLAPKSWDSSGTSRSLVKVYARETIIRLQAHHDFSTRTGSRLYAMKSDRKSPVPDRTHKIPDLARVGCLLEAAAFLLVTLIFALSLTFSAGEW